MMLFDHSNKQIVPPEGRLDAKLCVVGEAPGAQETRERRPFVGPSGNLLWELLAQVGVSRTSCYITNVVKEKPEGNNIRTFVDFSKKALSKSPMFDHYIEELKKELETTSSNLILAVGNIPIYALLGYHPPMVTKRRGSVYESTLLPGRKVMPIIHPAACLHGDGRGGGNYMYRHYILQDLYKASREMEFPELRTLDRDLIVIPSYDHAIDFLDRAFSERHKFFAIDLEVQREEVSHIGVAYGFNKAMSITLQAHGKNIFSDREEYEIAMRVGKIMGDESITKIIQNANFDVPYLYRKYRIVTRGPVYDTMVGQAILYPDFPKGLDFQVTMYTDVPYYKDEGKKHMKLVHDENQFALYNAKDTVVMPEIMIKQESELKKANLWDYALNHMKLIHPLSYMAERGIRVDTEGLERKSQKATETIANLERKFCAIAGYEVNLGSAKQLMQYFYGLKGLKPYLNRKSGNPSLDDNALQRIVRRDGLEEAIILRDWRKINKLKTTYFDMKFDTDGRMRCSWNSVGTRYSRLSSSTNIHGTGGNLQNQPHSLKEFFLADEGYMIFQFDLAQADWRIVAYLARDPKMIEALINGKDIHRLTASLIFNKPPDEISDEDGSAPFGNGDQSERFWGKKCVPGNTEVLTLKGWTRIDNILPSVDKIAQFHPNEGSIHFVDFEMNSYDNTDDLITFQNKMMHITCTPGHRVLFWSNKTKQPKVIKAQDLKDYPDAYSNNKWQIPTAGKYSFVDKKLSFLSSDEIRLLVAIQADGSYTSSEAVAFKLKKLRKIERLKSILDSLEMEYSEGSSIYIPKQDTLTKIMYFLGGEKNFGDFLLKCDFWTLRAFVDELPYWDGYIGSKKKQYFSTNKNNVIWAQTICHLVNMRATYREREASGFGKKPLYIIGISDANTTTLSTLKISQDKADKVYSPTVPSGFYLIRSNDRISITGNSNHAFNYGQSYRAFALQMLIPENEARIIHSKYHAGYPGIKGNFWKNIEEQLRRNRTITNLFGRSYTFFDRFGPDLLNAAYSFIPQSTVADIMNQWGINHIWYKMSESPVEPLLQVHDSIVFQIPISIGWNRIASYVKEIKQSLESELHTMYNDFVIPVDCEAGFNLGKADDENISGLKKIKITEDLAKQLEDINDKSKL